MSTIDIENEASRISPKRAEMVQRRHRLRAHVEEHQPASVRHVFYLAVVAMVAGITKNDSGYQKVQRALVDMRIDGTIPYTWIVDNTRWVRRPRSFKDVNECLTETARFYRRDLWANRDVVEVWAESDSIAGVLTDVTYRWNVPLMVTRGFSSITFARSAVDAWNAGDRAVTVYYVGDHDPHGLAIESKLRDYIADWATVSVQWQRIGVTWDQVETYDLPGTRPKKEYGFPLAVEAEALPPGILRDLLDEAVAGHVDPHDLHLHLVVEAEEQCQVDGLPAMLETMLGSAS